MHTKNKGMITKILAIIVLLIFLFNTVIFEPAFSSQNVKNAQNLATRSCLGESEFMERFHARKVIVSHEAVNQYIKGQIEKVIEVRGKKALKQKAIHINAEEALLIAIPGLLSKTGQFAHVGLGREYGIPVIYIDNDFYDDEDVLRHESEEISQWEDFRKTLGKKRSEMRRWILDNIGEARQKAKEFHDKAHPINGVYSKFAGAIDFDLEYINKLLMLYGTDEESGDINIAAKDDSSQTSPAACLRILYENKNFKDKSIAARNLALGMGLSMAAVREKLNSLAALGLVDIGVIGRAYVYSLSDILKRAPPEWREKALDEICAIPELKHYELPSRNVPAVKKQITKILGSRFSEPVGKIRSHARLETLLKVLVEAHYTERIFTITDCANRLKKAYPQLKFSKYQVYSNLKGAETAGWVKRIDRTRYELKQDIVWEYLIRDKRFIDLFEDARGRGVKPSKENIARLLQNISDIKKDDFGILSYEGVALVYLKGEKGSIYRIIRYAPHSHVDYLSSERANPNERHSANVMENGFKFELLRDKSEVLENYLEMVKMYHTTELKVFIDRLLSENPLEIREAVRRLRDKYYVWKDSQKAGDKKLAEYALKLLHTQMYSSDLRERTVTNRIMHDIYTGRPADFPEAKTFKVVRHQEAQAIEILSIKGEAAARICWSVDGRLEKPLRMGNVKGKFVSYIPVATGTIHYAIQVKRKSGDWDYRIEPEASGVIKTQKDVRGKHILEVRTSIFDLPKDENGLPVRKEDGTLKISSFEQLKDRLPDLKHYYDAIWLMDVFEWGPIVPPGKDPSSFAPLDHVTVAKELGGEKGLRDLKEEADRLGIELVLNLIPHISQANTTYGAHFPVYCYSDGRLVRRASSDGLGDWYDSWQPNWRRKEVMDAYVEMAVKFAKQGYSFRADVAHAFDTTFEVHPQARGLARLFGDIVTTDKRYDGHFQTTDLAGSKEPNVILSRLAYEIQARAPNTVIYGENFATKTEDRDWQANDERLVKSGIIPYNSLHEELAQVLRDSKDVAGIINHILYRKEIRDRIGGQDVTIYASHDYQRDPQHPDETFRDKPPLQLYGDGLVPFLTSVMLLNYNGPVFWHFARLLGEDSDDFLDRHNLSLAEFWKIWVNNIREFDFEGASNASLEYLKENPRLAHLGEYVRALRRVLEEYDEIREGEIVDVMRHDRDCLSVVRKGKSGIILGFVNYGYHNKDIFRSLHGLPKLKKGQIYELKELFRYSKKDGLSSSKKYYLSDKELRHLGLHERMSAWETAVYSVEVVEGEEHSIHTFGQSLLNYKKFGVSDRVKYSVVSTALIDALEKESKENSFFEFIDRLRKLIEIADVKADVEFGVVGTILFDISKKHPEYKGKIEEFITRAALDEQLLIPRDLRYKFIRVLRGMHIGEVVITSLETRGISSLGGVALYTRDIAKTYNYLGLDTTLLTWFFSYNREGRYIFDHVIRDAGLEFTGRVVNVSINGQNEMAYIYRTMLDEIETLAMSGNLTDVLYGKKDASNEDKARRFAYFGLTLLEAIRTYNLHPSVLHTNEIPGLALAYLNLPRYRYLLESSHLRDLLTYINVDHNLERNYQNILTASNPQDKDYLMNVLGFDPWNIEQRRMVDSDPDSLMLNLTYIAAKAAKDFATVSHGYRMSTVSRSQEIGLGNLLSEKYASGRYYAEQNGIDTVNWQKRIFRERSFFECRDKEDREKLRARARNIKREAKHELQSMIGLKENENAPLITMLHRFVEQKGYEIAIPAIERVLETTQDVQVVIGGPADEDEPLLAKMSDMEKNIPADLSIWEKRV